MTEKTGRLVVLQRMNSSIFRENSVYLHRFNEIIYIKVWKEKNYFTTF